VSCALVSKNKTYWQCHIVHGGRLVRLASILLQVFLELSGLSVANLYRPDSSIVRLLKLDRTVTYIFTWNMYVSGSAVAGTKEASPSISFQALRKSSGSEKATKPYFA
jgi:hypothetical protein